MKKRTTVALEDDLFQQVQQEAAHTRRRFDEVLNDRLRRSYSTPIMRPRRKFKVEPFQTNGFAPGVDERKLNQLFDSLESGYLNDYPGS